MWVSRKDTWHKDTTDLEKFFAERLIQRCDYEESISKKHRTISGFTLLKELIKLCELFFLRNRTIRSLMVQLEEAQSKHVRQNITNDMIIRKYFVDLKEFIRDYDINKLQPYGNNSNLNEVTQLLHRLRNFERQLDRHYLPSLQKELLSINFIEEEKFHREAKKISDIVDLIIPYYLFKGYSITSVNEVLRKWLGKSYRVTAQRLITFFNFNEKEFEFLINIPEEDESSDDFIKLVSKSHKIKNLVKKDINRNIEGKQKIKKSFKVISYDNTCFDPNAHIRNMYDELLKNLVISKDRKSLAPFTHYFDNCYWSNKKHHSKAYYQAKILGDPISIPARKSTLRNTLKLDPSIKGFKENSEIRVPQNEQLRKAIYYYNLALGSKSLENSISLLWTTIETIIPYRTFPTDIECVKFLLGKSLSLGAICRDIYSFVERFKVLNKQNDTYLSCLIDKEFNNQYSDVGLQQWYNWLSNQENIEDRFEKIKNCSQLLAYEYLSLGRPLVEGKIEFLLDRLSASRKSIEYQLQRIYLHRNQIVHSGDMINEYSNLWIHLEWYAGKLLYHCLNLIEFNKVENDLEGVFRQLESDYDYMESYMKKNASRKINDVERIKDLILQHNWQAF